MYTVGDGIKDSGVPREEIWITSKVDVSYSMSWLPNFNQKDRTAL